MKSVSPSPVKPPGIALPGTEPALAGTHVTDVAAATRTYARKYLLEFGFGIRSSDDRKETYLVRFLPVLPAAPSDVDNTM